MGTLSSRKLLPDSQDSGEPSEDRNAIKAEVGVSYGALSYVTLCGREAAWERGKIAMNAVLKQDAPD